MTLGTKLGDYEIKSVLGAGGMGEVYRAHDSRLGRDVAIKVLPAEFSTDADRLRRFEQEARAAAALNHPNILGVFQMGTFEGSPYLVSELLEGETLRGQLKRGHITVRNAIDYGVQIARGLSAAHDKGIMHRDLKPENLFVTKDGRVKILDFGLAKLMQPQVGMEQSTVTMGGQTEPGVVMGTLGYMSPEQVRGQNADHRTDIFAFGAILYEMLSGKRAFQKPTSADTMSAILNEDPTSISQLAPGTPPALQRVVKRCLEKNPEQRFQSASDLAFALEALSDSGTASAVTGEVKSRAYLKWAVTSFAAIALLGSFIVWWILPPAVPVVTAVTQLTNDGVPKYGRVLTDGSRIYFNEGETGSWNIAQVAVTGGETSLVPTRLIDPQLMAIAPDASFLLALPGEAASSALWIIPLPSGEPRPVGEIEAHHASFFPDGRVVLARGTEIYSAEKDGSNLHKLIAASESVFCPVVSPNGTELVFATKLPGDSWFSLVEAPLNGSGLRKIVNGTKEAIVRCPRWTPDGNNLVFSVSQPTGDDIWIAPTPKGLLHLRTSPTQLSNGPLSYTGGSPSLDGKRIFAIGTQSRGELVRYDSRSHHFLPFLSGMSAINPTFSRDGRWVAYASYPDYTLWRSGADGTERLQLTYPPMKVMYPFISPDGRQIAFSTNWGEIYVAPVAGGALRKVMVKDSQLPHWSPDGNLLVLTLWIRGKHAGDLNSYELGIYDLRSDKFSVVPASQGIIGTWWLNDGSLVGGTEDLTKLMKFDFRTGEWSGLAQGNFINWAPSLDSKYMYYTTGGTDPKAMRVALSNREIEEVANLKDLRRVVDLDQNTQISVAPDNSPVFTRDIGRQEVYALDVKWP